MKASFFFSDITRLHQLQVHFKSPTWCKIHIMFPSSDVTHSSLSANSTQMSKVYHPASSVMAWSPHGYRPSGGEEKQIDDSPIKAHIR